MKKAQSELLHGTLEMLILRILETTALHGYAIGQRIRQLSKDSLRIEQGSLYPALYRMERRGWICSSWAISEQNRRAKVYDLTPTGRRQLDIESSAWEQFTGAVSRIMRPAEKISAGE